MKTISILTVAGLAAVATANPIDRSNFTIYTGAALEAAPMDTSKLVTAGVQYSNLGLGNNFASTETGLTVGVADYDSVADDDINMGIFTFVGGVSAVGGVLFFDFFDAGGNFYDGFGVQLPQAGNFIWTITLNTPQVTLDAGSVAMFADDGFFTGLPASTGTWFLNAVPATIGSAGLPDGTDATGAALDFKFAIEAVPAPASVALLGLGGLVATRRRR